MFKMTPRRYGIRVFLFCVVASSVAGLLFYVYSQSQHPERQPFHPSPYIPASRPSALQLAAEGDHAKEDDKPIIPVLLMACNRPDAVRKSISALLPLLSASHPLIVSHGCEHEPTRQAILAFSQHLMYMQAPPKADPSQGHLVSIAEHYGWALRRVFKLLRYEQAIIIEDDMQPAVDFIAYFEHFLPLLRADPSLLCISAWNDHGKPELASDPYAFYRSDFFPGLGWMVTRDAWLGLDAQWPRSDWDQEVRTPAMRIGRACLFPEVARAANFGRDGSSRGLYHDAHVGRVAANQLPLHYDQVALSKYTKAAYDVPFLKAVYEEATLLDSLEQVLDVAAFRFHLPLASPALTSTPPTSSLARSNAGPPRCPITRPKYRIEYTSLEAYRRLGEQLHLLNDLWNGVPRMSYYGIVTLHCNASFTLYVAPHYRPDLSVYK